MYFDIVNLRLPCTENKTHPHQQTKNNETTRAGRERQSIVNTYAGVTGQSWVSVFCFFSFFGRKDLRCQILQATGGHTAHCKRNGFALTKIGMTRATKNKICEKKNNTALCGNQSFRGDSTAQEHAQHFPSNARGLSPRQDGTAGQDKVKV